MKIFLGIIIPFIGTTLGAALVFLMKDKINKRVEKFLLGFASGVMIAASIWSLIIPSIEMSEEYFFKWIPATVGFVVGIFFLLVIDKLLPGTYEDNNEQPLKKKTWKMVSAITIHNIPEGIAVGVVFAGVMLQEAGVTLLGAMTLAFGIAVQNFPEGAIVSMPLKSAGYSKKKSFIVGTLSGAVEPLFACITLLLIQVMRPILPYLLAFAAGTMIYVVACELLPESQDEEKSSIPIIGLAFGFCIMMVLDVSIG